MDVVTDKRVPDALIARSAAAGSLCSALRVDYRKMGGGKQIKPVL